MNEYILQICSLSTIVREYVALWSIRSLPFKDLILSAAEKNIGCENQAWKISKSLEEYVKHNHNETQQEAIQVIFFSYFIWLSTALFPESKFNAWGFCLLCYFNECHCLLQAGLARKAFVLIQVRVVLSWASSRFVYGMVFLCCLLLLYLKQFF